MSTAWIVIDDTDPRIQYSGSGWKLDQNIAEKNSESFSGDVYNSTLHSSIINGTTFSFRFNGTSGLALYSTQDFTDSDSQFPSVECLLDEKHMLGFVRPVQVGTVQNNQILCRADPGAGLSGPGEHELKVNVTFTNPESPILFDFLVYETLPDAPLDGDVLQMGNGVYERTQDPHFSFGPGWGTNVNDAKTTSTPGSSVTIEFNGTTATVIGELTSGSSNTAFYSLDEGTPVPFQLFSPGVTSEGGDSDNIVWTYQNLFSIPNMSPGTHSLVITHNGTASGMPLTIDYLLVTSLTTAQAAQLSSSTSSSLLSSVSTSASATSSSSSASQAVTSTKKANTGAIIGATLGCLALVVVSFILVIQWRRRRRTVLKPDVSPFIAANNAAPDTLTSPHSIKQFGASSSQQSTESSSDSSRRDNLAVMKLEQRLTVMHNQVQERNNQLAEAAARLQQSPTFHTDSGIRFVRDSNGEVPPNYTPS